WKRRWILPGGETPCPGSAGHRESRPSLAGLVSIRAARKLRAEQQDDALDRLAKTFDDEQKPTFVWRLSECSRSRQRLECVRFIAAFPQGAPKAVLKHAHSKRFARSGDVHGGPPIRAIR